MFSGFGGQVDFIRGSAEGVDGRGKPIIALVSVTKKGESKIVPTLKVGQYTKVLQLYKIFYELVYCMACLIELNKNKQDLGNILFSKQDINHFI